VKLYDFTSVIKGARWTCGGLEFSYEKPKEQLEDLDIGCYVALFGVSFSRAARNLFEYEYLENCCHILLIEFC